jgi:hypothetical protein
MSQVLHIFKKDVRHLWPEIVISLVLTAAFVRASFGGVSNFNGGSSSNLLPLFSSTLGALVPVGWLILTARAIHDESLVGESQFWVTRPYRWQKLLAAKAIFLVAFLYLPIFLAQVVLLAGAGFHPFPYLPGLFYNLVLLTGVLVLPIAALATITSNFARLVLTLLGSVAYLGVIILALTFVRPPDQFSFPNPYEGKLTFSLFFLVFLVVIVLQYATRHTWRSRWILLGLPFLVIAGSVAWPIQTVARHLYPPLPAAEQRPVELTFDPDPERQSSVNPSHERARIDLYLPLAVSGISSGAAIQNQGVQVSIESSSGLHWNSKWQNISKYYRSDTSRSFIDIPIDEKFLDRVKSTPVTVTLTFALIQLRAGTPASIQATDKDFALIGGLCSFPTTFSTYPECRFAMSGPKLAFVTTQWTPGPCSQTVYSSVPSGSAQVWVGTIDTSPAGFGLDPVKVNPLVFPYPSEMHHPSYICPGTPIVATPYSVVRRVQTSVAIPDVDLTKYTVDRLDGPARSKVTAKTR